MGRKRETSVVERLNEIYFAQAFRGHLTWDRVIGCPRQKGPRLLSVDKLFGSRPKTTLLEFTGLA